MAGASTLNHFARASSLAPAGRGPMASLITSKRMNLLAKGLGAPTKRMNAGSFPVSVASRAAASQEAQGSDDILDQLRQENAALRATLEARLDQMDEGLKEEFLAKHSDIIVRAKQVGEVICAVGQSPGGDSISEPAPATEKDGVLIQVEADNTLVFKFSAVSNSKDATSMAADGLGGGQQQRKKSNKEVLVFNFEKDDTAAAAAAAEPSSSGSSGSDEEEKPTSTATRKKRTTTKTNKTTATTTKKADPWAAKSAAATKEAESHDTAAALKDKSHWLYATVPATPVAGALCTLYFNKEQSEVLRHRPHIQIQARFNNWELEPAGDAPDRLDMTDAGHLGFQKVSFTVPADAYEFNFIFSDGEGLYDNNNSENYCLPVDGPMTKELWIDTAPERAEAAYLARKEAERVAAEKAAKEREEAALVDDATRAEEQIAEIKNKAAEWQQGGNVLGDRFKATATKTKLKLQYNRLAGPITGFEIPEDQNLVLKIGHNGWKNAIDVVMERTKPSEDTWQASVALPKTAAVMNFVVQYYEHCDNNGGADFKIVTDLDLKTVDSLLPDLKKELTATRHAAEKAAADEEAARLALRNAVRAKAEEVRRKQMRHVLYTEPASPQAGKEVTIAYNPNNTVLHGAEKVYLRGGYNRWRHPKTFGPIEMQVAEGQHYTASITVPKDAYSLEFVFSDAEEHGRYDNAGGLDYHLPVEESVVAEPPLYVVHVAAEMAPIAKVGGLGDVVTALGRAVQEAGHQVEVILPRYDFFLQSPLLGGTQYETEFDWEGTRIFVSSCMVEGLRCWFIEPSNGMFATSTVYQGASDAAKFAFFSRAALEFLLRTQRQPDILHCHDWSTADVAKAYWETYHWYGLWRPKVVFTIHNLNYGQAAIGDAAYFSQRFTTVSPSYAWEIGGHPAVAPHTGKLMGIRNGIDVDIWNPETDQFLPVGYNAENVEQGKAAAREELRKRVGLSGWGDKPLVGVVTRLTKQKGTHLIAHSAWRTLDRGGQFVLLGSAPDPKIQAEFDGLAASLGGENAAFCFAFDEPLSHLIYAACDLILVPSMFEPCGLTQMIAMRYGAVPVVRATGGLRDTVFDVDNDKARAAWELEGSTNWQADEVDETNGFSFEGTDADALDYALNRALDAWYNDRAWFRSLQQRVMKQDWSWNKPAISYIDLYFACLK